MGLSRHASRSLCGVHNYKSFGGDYHRSVDLEEHLSVEQEIAGSTPVSHP